MSRHLFAVQVPFWFQYDDLPYVCMCCLSGYIPCCIKASAACIRVGFQMKSSSVFFREMFSNPQEAVEPESIREIYIYIAINYCTYMYNLHFPCLKGILLKEFLAQTRVVTVCVCVCICIFLNHMSTMCGSPQPQQLYSLAAIHRQPVNIWPVFFPHHDTTFGNI